MLSNDGTLIVVINAKRALFVFLLTACSSFGKKIVISSHSTLSKSLNVEREREEGREKFPFLESVAEEKERFDKRQRKRE